MSYIGKILPVDGYYASFRGDMPTCYGVALTHLYQPLIGAHAITLYQTLLADSDIQSQNTPQTHHTLMSYLSVSLETIYQARQKLEGIGLLKTYRKTNEQYTIYFYVLLRPFTPREFFSDGMLSELLYHHLGYDKFHFLKKALTQKNKQDDGENITASFSDIFKTVQVKSHDVTLEDRPQTEQVRKTKFTVNFTWIEQMLKQRHISPGKVLTHHNKKMIEQMAELYNLAINDIEKTVLWALTADNELDIDEFKTACFDLFKSTHDDANIQLVDKVAKQTHQEKPNEDLTKEEQLIRQLESISPRQLLADFSNANHASSQEVKLIGDLMANHGLPAPVMNVLIHYVLLQTNMKLSKNYMEKIATHWSRAKLTTAKQAMDFAKNEQTQYKKRTQQRQRKSQPKSREVVPDWFKEQEKKKQQTQASKQKTQTEIDKQKEKEEIDALLREFTQDK